MAADSMSSSTDDTIVNENSPAALWWRLFHESIKHKNRKLCDDLIDHARMHLPENRESRDLVANARRLRDMPGIKKTAVAILGETGAGKSTILNATLDRDLLGTSGAVRACTPFATLITGKDGAPDQTCTSDIKVEFFNDEEVKECINGEIQHFADAFPCKHNTRNSAEDSENEEVEEHANDSNETPNIGDSPDTQSSDLEAKMKAMEAQQAAVGTAKAFFELVFNTEEDEEAKKWLDEMLYKTDIRKNDFKERCFQKVQEFLAQITAKLDVRDRIAEFQDVSDQDVKMMRSHLQTIWPFVKLLTIATGNVLLRHGLCFYDLPGYGDINNLRRAVINTYHWKADFDIVVVQSSRSVSNITQNSYINRSIHLRGPEKTLIVMNKADQLMDATTMDSEIQDIKEAPFPAFLDRRARIQSLREQDVDNAAEAIRLDNALNKEILAAFKKHQTNQFAAGLRWKDIINVKSTATLHYLAWKRPIQRPLPHLDLEDTGIPSLRKFLSHLPAESNFIRWKNHVCESLSALRFKGGCAVEKHDEDPGYARMRRDYESAVPNMRQELNSVEVTRVNTLVVSPWNQFNEAALSNRVRQMITKDWIQPKIYYPGFLKMLRENGIPMNGKYAGRNLNDEILRPMKPYLRRWYNDMQPRVGQLAQVLLKPISDLLQKVLCGIEASSADPALKRRAKEAQEATLRRIKLIYDALMSGLSADLRENYLRCITEVDIFCFIARYMQPVYVRAQHVPGRKGAYERLRNSIKYDITPHERSPHLKPPYPVINNLETRLTGQQKQLWKARCNAFTVDVMLQLTDFSDTIERLLADKIHETKENKKHRKQFKRFLESKFDKDLQDLQAQFNDIVSIPSPERTEHDEPMDDANYNGESSTLSLWRSS